jgi:cyclopropane fatty-acyl-phospholipid synthase-like methyltransferase
MFMPEDISRYYDLCEVHYRRVWDLDNSRSLHYGYWDGSVKTFQEALLNINKVLADHARIGGGEKVLDAGCGIGGSSIWLAKERGCQVIGISLNKKQVDKANVFANLQGLAGKVFFEQKDYTSTSYEAGTFDVVWAIESVCYANDKGMFLKEASRLLKPGGRLVIADFFKKENLNLNDAKLVRRWAHGWAVNDFSTVDEFKRTLKENNFRNEAFIDATGPILPSAKKLYRSYFPGAVGAWLYGLFKPNATKLGKNNVRNAYLQYKTLKKGLWTYQIVKAVK